MRCTYFGIVLNTTGKTKLVFYSAVGTLCLNTIMNIAFYKIMGVVGPALATLLSGLIMGTLQLVFSSRLINVKFSEIFPWKNMALTVLVNLALGVVFHFAHKILLPGNIQAVVLAVVWGVAYCLIMMKPAKYYWKKLKSV